MYRGRMVGALARLVGRDHCMGIVAELQPFVVDLFTQGLQSLQSRGIG